MCRQNERVAAASQRLAIKRRSPKGPSISGGLAPFSALHRRSGLACRLLVAPVLLLLAGLGERGLLDLRNLALVGVTQAQLDQVVLLHALQRGGGGGRQREGGGGGGGKGFGRVGRREGFGGVGGRQGRAAQSSSRNARWAATTTHGGAAAACLDLAPLHIAGNTARAGYPPCKQSASVQLASGAAAAPTSSSAIIVTQPSTSSSSSRSAGLTLICSRGGSKAGSRRGGSVGGPEGVQGAAVEAPRRR